MWTCPKCHSKVDASFEVCWNCGTTPEGVEDPTFVRADDAPPAESPLDLDMPEGDEPLPTPEESPESDLVECYWAANVIEAKWLADQLSEQGIPAMSDTEDMHAELGSMRSGPRVYVRSEDLREAKAWLAAYDRQRQAEHGAE